MLQLFNYVEIIDQIKVTFDEKFEANRWNDINIRECHEIIKNNFRICNIIFRMMKTYLFFFSYIQLYKLKVLSIRLKFLEYKNRNNNYNYEIDDLQFKVKINLEETIKLKKAIYPGSFDPVTLGHLDIIERSSKLVDHLIVGVLNNNAKTPLFSVDERVNMLKEVTSHLPNVEVMSFSGLLVEFAKEHKVNAIIRGLRAVTDFEYELAMSQTNKVAAPEIDTVFLNTSLEYAYLSSSIVKEMAMYNGDISKFVPEAIIEKVREKYKQ
jgi:pantetheine-phosphate adenylyltransferase